MNLHSASRRELRHIAAGTGIGTLVMLGILSLPQLFQAGTPDPGIFIGAAGGFFAAVANFTALCLTVQHALHIEDRARRLAFLQLSRTVRLLLQGVWMVCAHLHPGIHVIAASLPLLFPSLTAFLLGGCGKTDARRCITERR